MLWSAQALKGLQQEPKEHLQKLLARQLLARKVVTNEFLQVYHMGESYRQRGFSVVCCFFCAVFLTHHTALLLQDMVDHSLSVLKVYPEL